MLIDTHCHLADPAFAADREAVVARMGAAGVGRALVIESVLDQLDATLEWVADDPRLALATGCHPHDAAHWSPTLAERVARVWRHPAVRAAGEMGLDYHYDHSPRDVQRAVFRAQLALGVAAGLPIIIHAREADDDVVAILEEQPSATVVLHSFSSGPALREAGLARGWYFSFSGMVTFKSWHDLDAVTRVADDRLLVETDAPYLAPVPHRGRRNEPAYVAATAARIAALRGITPERLAALTTANAERLFWPEAPAASDHAHPTES